MHSPLIDPFVEENGEEKDDHQNPNHYFKPFVICKKASHVCPSLLTQPCTMYAPRTENVGSLMNKLSKKGVDMKDLNNLKKRFK